MFEEDIFSKGGYSYIELGVICIKVKTILSFKTMTTSGIVKRQKSSGLRLEPCGTPNDHALSKESLLND